jgi:ketosteroid isomerase-like protein
MPRVSPDEARRFAAEWVAAWNAHDLEAILAHYAEDCTMASPRIVDFGQEPSGKLRGKDALRAYWGKALAAQPELRFTLEDVLLGVDGLTLLYRNQRGQRVAESVRFDAHGKVVEAAAQYALP